jgi:hypothetical protein
MRHVWLVAACLFCASTVRAQCLGDFNGDGEVSIEEIIASVNNSLEGCSSPTARFVDNGDGTVTDHKTGLQWEKKDQSGGIHDYSNFYSWCVLRHDRGVASCGSTNIMDGPLVTTFLAAVNSGGGFAGHTDWRIPNVDELESIASYQNANPAADAVFNTGCAAGCTVTTCSCTQSNSYWASTTYQEDPTVAWEVYFNDGFVDAEGKLVDGYVRAVRNAP